MVLVVIINIIVMQKNATRYVRPSKNEGEKKTGSMDQFQLNIIMCFFLLAYKCQWRMRQELYISIKILKTSFISEICWKIIPQIRTFITTLFP